MRPRHQIHNDLTWHSDFQQLYWCKPRPKRSSRSTSVGSESTEEESRSTTSGPTGILRRPLKNRTKKNGPEDEAEEPCLIVPAPVKRNPDRVICTPTASKDSLEESSEQISVLRSPLFWWIVALIVIPILFVIGLICAIVSYDIVTVIPSWVAQADKATDTLALAALQLTASSKASLMTAVVFESIRDLHLITRFAGFLYFGGIQRSSSFIEMDSASEECKTFPNKTCPFYFDPDRAPCPCEWSNVLETTCTEDNITYSRDLQHQFWGLQSQDADRETGARVSSASFPTVGSSPETTQWYANFSAMPGSWKSQDAAGFETSYDRTRVASATVVANIVVYNYANSLGWKNKIIGVYQAMQSDGLMMGFNGCDYTHPGFASWNSNENNHAAVVAPLLCPLGKYGYDPRCRYVYCKNISFQSAGSMP